MGLRYLPVGNDLAGLFTEAIEQPPEDLKNPLEIFGKPRALDPSRGATAAALIERLGLHRRRLLSTQEEKGRAWLQGEYLKVRRSPSLLSPSVLPHIHFEFQCR
jgi:hypothetical protein